MRGLALHIAAATDGADKVPVPDCDLSPDRDRAGPPLNLPSLECVVINVLDLRLRGELSPVIGIVNDEIGVAPDGNGPLARKQAEELRGIGARGGDEGLEVEPPGFHAVGEEK